MVRTFISLVIVLVIVAIGYTVVVIQPWDHGVKVVPAETDGVPPAIHFETLRDEGINVERVYIEAKKSKAVLYVSYSRFFRMPVLLRAYDQAGKEIGRCRRVLSGDREDAGYADFEFDPRVPLPSATFMTLTKSQVEEPPAESDLAPVRIEDSTVPAATPTPVPATAPSTQTAPAEPVPTAAAPATSPVVAQPEEASANVSAE